MLALPSLSRRSGAMLLVLAVHLLFAALLFTGRELHVARAADPVEVSFVPEARAPEPAWQPPAPPLTTTVETQLLVPTPEVAVAAAAPVMLSAAQSAPISSDSAPTVSSGPIEVSDVEYVKEPTTRYPAASKRLREQGTVLLRVVVDATGRASQVNIYRSSGFPRLDAAACEAVRHALFKPYVYEGQAQAALVFVPIEFSLRA